jgi:hypothetical protein
VLNLIRDETREEPVRFFESSNPKGMRCKKNLKGSSKMLDLIRDEAGEAPERFCDSTNPAGMRWKKNLKGSAIQRIPQG